MLPAQQSLCTVALRHTFAHLVKGKGDVMANAMCFLIGWRIPTYLIKHHPDVCFAEDLGKRSAFDLLN